MAESEKVILTNMCMVYDGNKVLVQDRLNKNWKGLTFPGGHIEKHESFTDAVIREVKEETGIDCFVKGLVGFRSGVIRGEISDNMAILYCDKIQENQPIIIQEREILEAHWMSPEQLAVDELANKMLKEYAQANVKKHLLDDVDTIVPEEIFGYTKYNKKKKK